jgi:multicomponent Na+:H+ antiporter subunit B
VSLEAQRRLFLAGAVVLAAVWLWGLSGLPPAGVYRGPYGDVLNRVAVAERAATNVVASVTFDYRGFDTLGEEYILFAAVLGVAILLRAQHDEQELPPDDEIAGRHVPATSNAVRIMGLTLVGPTVLFGLYMIATGHLTVGGGFQGGVVLATGALLVYLCWDALTLDKVRPTELVEAADAAGAAGFAVAGVAGLVATGAFLANFLPLGAPGRLLSAGTMPLINVSTGLEVGAGFVLIISSFLRQTLEIRRRRQDLESRT